jgi:DNA-directed RNA polymerase specialized sigma24 family protein
MDRVAFGHRLTRGYGLRNDPRGSDKKQVRMATSVESVAFVGMYDVHAAELLRYLWWRCGDRTQAEDLLSVVFLEAWRRGGVLRPTATPRPWLYGIATNVLRNHLRSVRRHRAARPGEDVAPSRAAFDRWLVDMHACERHPTP